MFEVQEITDLDIAFPTSVSKLMPEYEDIPDEFKGGNTKWNQVFSDWFFGGITIDKAVPKEGVDTNRALRHLKAVIGSFEPKQEHKEAAIAFLLSEWFEEFEYTNIRMKEDKR